VGARVEARSGAMLAGFAEMAAVAAEADIDARATARRLGRDLAVARQLVNDLTELLSGRTSDLRNRTATMIGAFALQRAPTTSRIDVVESLRTAATDEDVRRRLIGGDLARALADVHMLARLHLGAARSAAENLVGHSADRGAIDMLIDETNSVLNHCFSGGTMTDESRAAKYDLIRKRFLSDPEFRDQVAKDPSGTLESILGPLTDQERSWLDESVESSASTDELLDRVRMQPPPVGIW